MKKERNKNPIQPVSGTKIPRYAGPNTFARLPELRDVQSCDVAIVGVIVLAVDRIGSDFVLVDQRCRYIILGTKWIAGTKHHLGTATLES